MTRNLILQALLVFMFTLCSLSCKKSGNDSTIDEARLTGRDWKSSKNPNPWTILRFNADKTGTHKSIANLVTNTYQTFTFTWARKDSDSLTLHYNTQQTFTLKVYSITDTTLVTNNWYGISDTTRTTYYSY